MSKCYKIIPHVQPNGKRYKGDPPVYYAWADNLDNAAGVVARERYQARHDMGGFTGQYVEHVKGRFRAHFQGGWLTMNFDCPACAIGPLVEAQEFAKGAKFQGLLTGHLFDAK